MEEKDIQIGLGNKDNELVLANIENYQSAQALSVEAIKIFETLQKSAAQVDDNNSSGSIVYGYKIENSLVNLNGLLNHKASPQDLMKIVHMQIHPSLQMAYNLESKIN